MHLNSIGLRNFKCFRDVEIPFSKITLLAGENSSGKSSLIDGYLSALQSGNFPFELSVNGRYVNMGDFKDMANKEHQRRTDNGEQFVDIDLEFLDDEGEQVSYKTRWTLDRKTSMARALRSEVKTKFYDFRVTSGPSAGEFWFSLRHHNTEEYIQSQEFKFGQGIYELLDSLEESRAQTENEENRGQVSDRFQNFSNVRRIKFTDIWSLRRKLGEYGYFHGNRVLSDCIQFMESVTSHFNFIGSYRLQPERAYYIQKRSDLRLGVLGEKYVDQILEWETKNDKRLPNMIAALEETGLLSGLETQTLSGGRFELRVMPRDGGTWATLSDVGFGISQFLPIMVADFQLPKGSTLAVAQPELHLHPSVQANLADYFVKQSNRKAKRYIIETHSEYLLNRLRLNIVRGVVDPNDISVFYFENDGQVSRCTRVKFLADGSIQDAPESFFDTYMMDTMAIAMDVPER